MEDSPRSSGSHIICFPNLSYAQLVSMFPMPLEELHHYIMVRGPGRHETTLGNLRAGWGLKLFPPFTFN